MISLRRLSIFNAARIGFIPLITAFLLLHVMPFTAYSAQNGADAAGIHAKAVRAAKSGDFKQAIALLSPYAVKPLKYPEAYSDYLVFIFWDGRPKEAVGLFEKLPAKFPRKPYLLRNMAKAYYDIGDLTKAAGLYEAVLKQIPADEEARKGLNRSKTGLLVRQVHDRALKAAGQGNFKEAISLLSPYVTEPLEYPEVYADYLVFLVWDNRQAEAIGLYGKLPEAFVKKSYLLRNMAKAYLDTGNFTESLRLYKTALDKAPSDDETRKGLVMSLIQGNELDQALNYIDLFLKDAPGSLFLGISKAGVLVRQGKYVEGLGLYRALAGRADVDWAWVYRQRDNLIASLSHEKRQAMSASLAAAAATDAAALPDHILLLALNHNYPAVIKALESLRAEPDNYLLARIAWAYFKTGNVQKAMTLYRKVLLAKPDYPLAARGLAYCLASEGKWDEALTIVDRLIKSDPKDLDSRFARAFVFEKKKEFWAAINTYDDILDIVPGNPTARKLRLRAFSDMGGVSLALTETEAAFPEDIDMYRDLRGDMAVKYIQWGEPKEALKILEPQSRKKSNLRARFDRIGALAGINEMKKVTASYEEMLSEQVVVPSWVLNSVAGAYLYLEQPRKALGLYDEAVKSNPHSFDARMGRFYALQELREWRRAEQEQAALDKETPALLGQGKNIRPNWSKMEVTLAKGWLFAYEDRLREADRFFSDMHARAPYNTDTRDGMAHVWLWRGWPRKALDEFRIIDTIEPNHVGSRIGKADALDTLAFKEEARKDAGDLLKAYPRNKHVQQLDRSFKVEDMRELDANASFTSQEGGYEQFRADIQFFQPISLYTRLNGYVMTQKDSDRNSVQHYRRGGMGFNHIFNASWRMRQQFSANYSDGRKFGSFTELDYTPDDYWTLSAAYDSFSTDVPLRARVYGTEAKKYDLAATYRQSEWREFHLGLSRLDFSDGNKRIMASLVYEQGLWVKNNWMGRLLLSLDTSRNSSDTAPYFNPARDRGISVTYLIANTIYRFHNRSLIQRFYLTVGGYGQSGFSARPIAAFRYERSYNFSDTRSLILGISLSRNSYDGESTDGYMLDLSYMWRF